ncbi:MAG: HAD family acid phosphatase [Verrucomicrobiota bacterium]
MQYHNTIDALVYDQTAAEDYALYLQCFALARMRLDAEIAKRKAAGATAATFYLVTDCDETILDNSAYNAWLIQTGRDFHDDTWRIWCRAQQARATPGAIEFMTYAASLGVTICYVTSRFEDTRAETAANLQALGFPLADFSISPQNSQLFLAGMSINGVLTKKKEQFAWLAQRFGVSPLVQMGDSLSDHDADRYSHKVRYDQRAANAEQDKTRWGFDWIAFPNSVYGAWRQSLKIKSGGVDYPATDEPTPVPFQPQPVRPVVTAAEAPKLGLLTRWNPNPPIA